MLRGAALKLGTALLELGTDDRPLDKGLKDARKKVTNEVKRTQTDVDALGGSFSKALGRFFTGAAIAKSVAAIGDLVRGSRDESVEIARLSQSVENAGVSWDEYGAKIERVIAARQRLAYSDSALRDSLSILTNMVGDVNRALELQTVAADLARGKNISLAEASTIVGKVATGNIGILARQGIIVDKNATSVEALAAISERFAGQSEKYAKEGRAAQERAAILWDNLRESAGGALESTAPVITAAAVLWSSLGHEAIVAAGAVATFSKAGKGAIPVLSGLKSGVALLGVALKGLFLNPVGLAILAIGGLVIGLKLLYEHSEEFRSVVNKLGAALQIVFGPILRAAGAAVGWLGDRFADLGRALGIVGDEADENLAKDIPKAAAAALTALEKVEKGTQDLRDKFKPAGVDSTADFLKMLGVDETAINQVLDTIYDTVGANATTKFKKITDQAYAKLQAEARASIFAEADAMAEIVKEGGAALKDAIKESGLTAAQYLERSKQKTKEAHDRLTLWTQGVAAAIQKARDLGQTELAADDRVKGQIERVHDLRLAWLDARNAALQYNAAVAPEVMGPPSPPRLPQPGPSPRPQPTGAPNLSVVQTNNFPQGSTSALAAAVEGATIDGITEGYRQQARRLAATV